MVALFAAEIVVRVAFPHVKDYVVPSGTVVIDEELGWRLRPGNEATHHSQYFDTRYVINRSGMRGPPRAAEPVAGVYRILFQGDSQIFGWGVAEGLRCTDLLEQGDPGLEVWNFGVLGYGFDQSLLAYERSGAIPADEVAFFVSGATFYRATKDFLYGKPKPRFELDEQGGLKLQPVAPNQARLWGWVYGVLNPFYLPYFVDYQLKRRKDAPVQSPNRPLEKPFYLNPFTKALLRRAAAVAGERGHKLSLVSVLQGADAEELKVFCEENAIALLKLEIDAQRIRLGKHDRHWNPEAHRNIAAQLRSWFEARGVRPKIED